MFAAKLLFYGAGFVLGYTWVVYPCLLWVLRQAWQTAPLPVATHTPSVTVLLTVHNEQDNIRRRLDNLLASDYKGPLELLVVSDGSTDDTERIVEEMAARNPGIRLRRTERLGKSGAQNKTVGDLTSEVVVLTDAEASFATGFLTAVARYFQAPDVGCVTGNLLLHDATDSVAESQGLYWRFEQFLRRLESDLGILATASGQCMAFRKAAFSPFEPVYGDDCVIPLDLKLNGYRTVLAEDAVAYDSMPSSPDRELRTRIRMTNRNLLGTLSRSRLLNPVRFPGTALSLVSHKLLRWFTPLIAVVWMATSILLCTSGALYALCLIGQTLFAAAAAIGWNSMSKGNECKFGTGQAYSFALANLGFALGIISAFRGNRITVYRS